MEAASGCPGEQSYMGEEWGICHGVGRRSAVLKIMKWRKCAPFFFSAGKKGLSSTTATEHPVGSRTQVSGRRICAAIQQPAVCQLCALPPPLPPQSWLLHSASLCNLVIIKIMKFFWNFSGDRIFLEVALWRHGGKTCRYLLREKILPITHFYYPLKYDIFCCSFFRGQYSKARLNVAGRLLLYVSRA